MDTLEFEIVIDEELDAALAWEIEDHSATALGRNQIEYRPGAAQ